MVQDSYRHKGLRKKLVEILREKGITDANVLQAMDRVPRHLFLDSSFLEYAYQDKAFPIGSGQTISQPFMVAYMSEALMLRGDERVLEIGTGSGYQTAILAKLADRIYSVERIRSLLERARKNFDQLQCRNVMTRLFDGSYGWKEEGPFDAILVTAGAPSLPSPLMEQLKIGGVLVIPVGDKNSQRLLRVRRKKRGFYEEDLRECSFVALVGEHGWEKSARKDYGKA